MMESALYRSILSEGEARGKAAGKAEGKAEGKADALILLVAQRLGSLDDATTRRIRGETRLELIDVWFREALLATDRDGLQRLLDGIRRTPRTEPPVEPAS